MSGVATMMALGLASVFALAGGLKMIDLDRIADEFRRLELPAPTTIARILPPVELVVAALLLLRPALGAWLALALLAGFTAVIVRTIRRGLDVSCGCLGSLNHRPVSWDAVARNGALAAMAALVAVTAPASLTRPDLAAVLVMVGSSLIAVIVVQVLALREITGQIWSVQLAGEVGRSADTDTRLDDEPSQNGPAADHAPVANNAPVADNLGVDSQAGAATTLSTDRSMGRIQS